MNILTTDNALHLLGGVLLAWLIWVGGIVASLTVIAVFAWMREGAQHRDDGQWVGWITKNRLIEAFSWVAGGAVFHVIFSTAKILQ